MTTKKLTMWGVIVTALGVVVAIVIAIFQKPARLNNASSQNQSGGVTANTVIMGDSLNDIIPMPDIIRNFTLEIYDNKIYIEGSLRQALGALNDLNNGVENITFIKVSSPSREFYSRYSRQPNDLGASVAVDVVIYYRNLNNLDYEEKSIKEEIELYRAHRASKQNIVDSLSILIKNYNKLLRDSDVLIAELKG